MPSDANHSVVESTRKKIRVLTLGLGLLGMVAIILFEENVMFMRLLAAAMVVGSLSMLLLIPRSSTPGRKMAPIVLTLFAIGIGFGTFMVGEAVGRVWQNLLYMLTLALAATSYFLRSKRGSSSNANKDGSV